MENEEYEKLYKFEKFYWWHVGRREVLNSFFKRFLNNKDNRILEIGCGTGGNLEILSNFGRVAGLDISNEALNFCRQRGFKNLFLGKAEKTDFSSESFDLVVALDVLEHTKEDKAIIKEAWRILKRGGYFLATVPAYQFLWSEHDEALAHQRRYLISDLSEKLNKYGFGILKISYFVSFVFPIIFGYRVLRKIFLPKQKKGTAYVILPKPINTFFIWLLRLESLYLKYFNFPFGTSIIVIVTK